MIVEIYGTISCNKSNRIRPAPPLVSGPASHLTRVNLETAFFLKDAVFLLQLWDIAIRYCKMFTWIFCWTSHLGPMVPLDLAVVLGSTKQKPCASQTLSSAGEPNVPVLSWWVIYMFTHSQNIKFCPVFHLDSLVILVSQPSDIKTACAQSWNEAFPMSSLFSGLAHALKEYHRVTTLC